LYAPFIIANGGGGSVADFIAAEDPNQFNNPAQTASDAVAYFSYQAANPDGAVHLLAYGNGVFGFEDLPANLGISDDDFNDAIFAFSFSTI
jgi:Domain of unknown function (DUF4114)